MSWQQLTLYLPQNIVEKAAEFLEEMGALSVTFQAENEEEIFEPSLGTTPLWQRTQLIALFEAGADVSAVIHALERTDILTSLSTGSLLPCRDDGKTSATGSMLPGRDDERLTIPHTIEIIHDQDWQKNCNDHFKPQCFADNLWVYPSWHEIPDQSKPHVLLDPGLAFGTGSHPTTALCLDWLARHIKPGDEVIDYGCGSGILAIAALKLGAKHVWAVDNDPQALEATLENGLRNECSMAALEILLPEQLPAITSDVLIANILANPLVSLAPIFSTLLNPGGKIVLSGILPEQVPMVMEAYQNWVAFLPAVEQDGWVRLEGKSGLGVVALLNI